MYSSTPRSNPISSSLSSPLAVSIIIGTLEILRISLHTCQPSIFGIITSRIIKAMFLSCRKRSTACSPSAASTTSKSLFTRKSRTSFLIRLSSSTTSIFNLFIVSPPCHILPLLYLTLMFFLCFFLLDSRTPWPIWIPTPITAITAPAASVI